MHLNIVPCESPGVKISLQVANRTLSVTRTFARHLFLIHDIQPISILP